jgi:hypothetical protein
MPSVLAVWAGKAEPQVSCFVDCCHHECSEIVLEADRCACALVSRRDLDSARLVQVGTAHLAKMAAQMADAQSPIRLGRLGGRYTHLELLGHPDLLVGKVERPRVVRFLVVGLARRAGEWVVGMELCVSFFARASHVASRWWSTVLTRAVVHSGGFSLCYV